MATPEHPRWSPPPGPAYANWFQRVVASAIDALVAAPLGIVGTLLVAAASDHATDHATEAGLLAAGIACYAGGLAVWVWNAVVRQGRTGQSVGKSVLGIRLVAESTGQPLGTAATFLRAVAHALDALPCYVGYLWPLWDHSRQTFADKLLSSVVVPHPAQPAPPPQPAA
jgi:uncharacterized RDD family membrane protein YckC